MREEKREHGRIKHHVVRGVESLAVLSIVLVPVIRKVRARQHKKHLLARRRFPILGH